MKFDVLICALNEEKNIKKLIEDIFLYWGWDLSKIIVVSDWSVDKTNDILKQMKLIYPNRLFMIFNKRRLWKSMSFNKWKQLSTSERLISLDADIYIDQYFFWEIFKWNIGDCLLIWGNPKPILDKKNFATLASSFSYHLVYSIKSSLRSGNNFFSAHWRCLALYHDLYKNITLPESAWTDQYMYFSAINLWGKFKYQDAAIVYYHLPQTITDYIKQWRRFQWASLNMKDIFSKEVYSELWKITLWDKMKKFFITFLRYPIQWSCWFVLYVYMLLFYSNNKKYASGKRRVSHSTK